MCLFIDEEETAKHSLRKSNKKLTFYKTFIVNKNNIETPFYSFIIPFNYSGYIVPETNLPDIIIQKKTHAYYKNEKLIEGGVIHANTQNRSSMCHVIPNGKEIPIEVLSDDVVAFGKFNDVCVFKYKIPKSSWLKIKKIKAKLYD